MCIRDRLGSLCTLHSTRMGKLCVLHSGIEKPCILHSRIYKLRKLKVERSLEYSWIIGLQRWRLNGSCSRFVRTCKLCIDHAGVKKPCILHSWMQKLCALLSWIHNFCIFCSGAKVLRITHPYIEELRTLHAGEEHILLFIRHGRASLFFILV